MRCYLLILICLSFDAYAKASEQDTLLLYEKTAETSQDPEEIYRARMSIAKIYEKMDSHSKKALDNYELAFAACKTRAEPLYYIGAFYNRQEKHDLAARALYVALQLAPSASESEAWIYEYGLLFEYSIATYWIERFRESRDACDKLLALPNLPQNYREATVHNRAYAHKMLTAPR